MKKNRPAVQALTQAQPVTDTPTAPSLAGTPSQPISFTITGPPPNTPPFPSTTPSRSVTEDASPNTASGTLTVHDVDSGEDVFQAPSAAGRNAPYGSSVSCHNRGPSSA